MRVGCTSGYFNPLHRGHLALLEQAKKLCDYLIVIVNNDTQVTLKGAEPFMDLGERVEILKALRHVDHVVASIDMDRTVLQTLKMVRPNVFLKGGDSTLINTPELDWCKESGVEVVFGVGGGKVQSSSWLKNRIKS